MNPESYWKVILAFMACNALMLDIGVGQRSFVALGFSFVPRQTNVASGVGLYSSQNDDDEVREESDVTDEAKTAGFSTAEERVAKRKLEAEKEKRTNIGVAVLSVFAACLNYANQLVNPVTELQLLVSMQDQSAPLSVIGHNGKPTVVDFWAPWCDNCRAWAPTLQSVEQDYSDKVNFVMVNGDDGKNWPLINRFGVDAIPHLALVSADGDVETALIGPIPKSVLSADLEVLLKNAATFSSAICPQEEEQQKPCMDRSNKEQLPYTMFDAFQNRPDLRNVSY